MKLLLAREKSSGSNDTMKSVLIARRILFAVSSSLLRLPDRAINKQKKKKKKLIRYIIYHIEEKPKGVNNYPDLITRA